MSITQLTETQEAGRRLMVIAGQLGEIRPHVEALIDYAAPKTARTDFPMEVEDIRKLRALEKVVHDLGRWALHRSQELR
jgi:hypothetical protein